MHTRKGENPRASALWVQRVPTVYARVLVVNPDRITGEQVESLLRQEGCQVEAVRRGKVTGPRRAPLVYDVLCTDMVLPDQPLSDFIQRIRQQERYGAMPLVGLVRQGRSDVVRLYVSCALSAGLRKSVRGRVLQGILEHYLYGLEEGDPEPVCIVPEIGAAVERTRFGAGREPGA